MIRITSSIFTALFFIPAFASAQITSARGGGGQFEQLLRNILEFGNEVIIPFIIGIGFLAFVWGMFQYFIAGGANEESKEKGKSLMINATLGFVFIIIFFGIVNLITTSIGLEGQVIENVPSVIVPE